MAAKSEPKSRPRARTDGEGATLVWLDSLAAGLCNVDAFLGAMRERYLEGEGHWEVLSLLDQYYRRGKLKPEIFQAVKSRLENSALGAEGETQVRRPPESAVTAPVMIKLPVTPAIVPTLTPATLTAPNAVAPTLTPSTLTPPTLTPPNAMAPNLTPPTLTPPNAMAPTLTPPTLTPPNAMPPSVATPSLTAPSVTSQSVTAPAMSDWASQTTVTLQQEAPKRRPAVREVVIGDVLRGRYRVARVLGHGGMGTVFEAIDEFRLDLPNSGQRIALKALHSAVTQREDLLSELQTEFQHLQSLSHPNIVRVHEFDRDAGVAFFTMELLTGALLSRVLSARGDTALPRPDALAIIRDIGAALAHAHSRGLVHGDVNPQNIFITNEGDLRILDFGASHQLPQALSDPQTAAPQRVPVATRGYASCELLEGQRPDARDDVFAFACVAYLLLSGRHPFPDRTALEARIRRVRARRPRGLTRRQWGVLQEGLRWDRSRRPSAIQEWLNRFGLQDAAPHLPALRELVKVPPAKSRLGLSTALAVVVVAVLAVGGFWLASNYESLLHSVSEWRTPAAPQVPQAAAPEVPQAAAPELPSNPAPALQPSTASSVPGAAPPSSTLAHPRSPSQQISASQQTSPSRPLSPSQPASLAPAPAVPPPASSQSASASQVKPKYPVAAPQPPDASARPATPVSSRIELASDSVDVAATDKIAHVTVRRKGSSRGVASFTWWTESGTAKPGLDFVPVTSHVETIGDGQSAVSLDVSLSDAPRSRAKSFYVVIDHAESGPALGARTLTMVTMQPTESAP